MKDIIKFVFIWEVLIILIVSLSSHFIHVNKVFTPPERFIRNIPYTLWFNGNFDGVHYLEIAEDNYQDLEQAFFPGYPLVIKTVAFISHIPLILSAQIVSLVSLIGALTIVYKLTEIDGCKRKQQFLIIACILIYPTSFFYGAVYNDSLFFLWCCLTLYFARKKMILYASITGAMATFTRLNGLALVFPILLEALNLNSKQWDYKFLLKCLVRTCSIKVIWSKGLLSLFLIPAAFITYLAYIQYKFNNWHLVFSSMHIWKQDKIVFPLQVFWRYIKIIFIYPSFSFVYFVAILELLFVLLYISLLIYSYRKIRLSYWVFILTSLLIPAFTGTFQGMPRYGLHLYPLFLSMSIFLEHKPVLIKYIYFIISFLLFVIYLSLFSKGYFIS